MATYLTGCQDLRRECEVGGTGPSAVTGQTGILARLVAWYANAYKDIQRRHQNWRWMRVGFTLSTSSGDDSYAYTDCTDDLTSVAIARFSRWWADDVGDPWKIYLTSAGVSTERYLIFLQWNYFKQIYKIGSQTNGYPAHVSIDPQNNIRLGPKPDGTYTVSGDYQRGVQALAADGDTPDFPSDYHDLIVYYAMEKYGRNAIAPEALERALTEGGRLMRSLELNQLHAVELAGPLV